MNKMPIFGGTTTTPICPSVGVDQVYNPGSENAQSGTAVAEAISNKPDIYIGTYIDQESYEDVNINIEEEPYAKIGDIYINPDENYIYQCVHSEIVADGNVRYTQWRILNNTSQISASIINNVLVLSSEQGHE